MGYTTEFRGAFTIEPPLKPEDIADLLHIAKTRHNMPGNSNQEDPNFPGFYCKWEPTKDGKFLEWNGEEKFYDYVPWLQYLVDRLAAKKYRLGGTVRWRGEEFDDLGSITIVGGKFLKVEGKPRA